MPRSLSTPEVPEPDRLLHEVEVQDDNSCDAPACGFNWQAPHSAQTQNKRLSASKEKPFEDRSKTFPVPWNEKSSLFSK